MSQPTTIVFISVMIVHRSRFNLVLKAPRLTEPHAPPPPKNKKNLKKTNKKESLNP